MVLTTTAVDVRRAIVGTAESQLGEAEDPRGSQAQRMIRSYFDATSATQGQEWSTVFVDWVWHRATGGFAPWGMSTTRAHDIVKWAKKNGRWLRENDPRDTQCPRGEPQPGDVLVTGDLTEPFLSRSEHYCRIGVVEEVGPATVVTIEGNRHNMVARTRHSRAFDGVNQYIAGYVRLVDLDDTQHVSDPVQVSEVPHTLEDMAQHRLVVDLDHLSAHHDLVRQVQTRLGHLGLMPLEEVDGVLGPHTCAALHRFCQAARLNSMGVRRFGPAFARKLIGMRAVPAVPVDYVPSALTVPPEGLKKALEFTLPWEDTCVDHPAERGVVVCRGITQVEYDTYRLHFGDPTRPVQFMEDREMLDVYHYLYWAPTHADRLELPLAVAVFDTAVSMGVGAVPLLLQETLGLVVDGVLGSSTVEAMQRLNPRDLALRLVDARGAYRYQRLEVEESHGVFLHDWLARDNDLRRYLG